MNRKKKNKPKCLIEELLFERYCSAIGKNLYHKNESEKSIFVPLLSKLSDKNYPNIYENSYYNISSSNNHSDIQKKRNKNPKGKEIIDTLNIHKRTPLIYQLMKNDIYTYEKKLIKSIEYITKNKFFDDSFNKKKKHIEEL